MENKTPNKIMANLFKRYDQLGKDSGGMADKYDYKAQEQIAAELRQLFETPGAVEVMSKKALFQLIILNGVLRAISFHRFHHPFSQSIQYI